MYNIFRQIIPLVDYLYKERIFVAIRDCNFYIELIIMIGSGSITFSKFKKSPKKEGYLF